MPTVVNAGALGAQGFAIIGPPGNYAGWSVSDAGDINGDGLDDVIIGTRGGAAYVLFGQGGGPGNIDLTNFSPSDGFRIYGEGGHFTGPIVSAPIPTIAYRSVTTARVTKARAGRRRA
mgnify:CR=1 FL=1